jgi:ribonuclease R
MNDQMTESQIEQKVLALVRGPDYRPVKPRVIAKQLRVAPELDREVKRVIKRLVRQGKLSYAANHLVRPAEHGAATPKKRGGNDRPRDTHQHDGIVGRFRRVSGGNGFVTPSGPVQPGEEKKVDIFIAAANARDAASGDTVLVRVHRHKSAWRAKAGRTNPEGEIAKILERETHQFVGTYFEAGGTGFVQIDGSLFTQPINVGDPGAKNAQPDDKVVIEMVRFPSHVHDGEGVIVEVLGKRGEPGVDTLSIIREFNLPGPFSDDVQDQSREVADAFDESIDGRLDLTGDTTITIDPVDARDFDDAVSVKQLPGGHWLLGVHIADVSHFVRPDTPLDREARNRATSVYLPDRVIPMIPEVISNNLASLQPGRVRYTQTVFVEFTADGIPVAADHHLSAIKSGRRFTYEEVDEYLADREAWRKELSTEVHSLLGRMHTLAMILRARRMRRGALELTLQEVKVDLDKQGRVTGAHVVENTESHQIIEEFMLAANEAIARKLEEEKLYFLRRVHDAPDLRKLKALTEFVRELGFNVESLESRFEIQKLLGEVHGRPEEHAVNYAVLRGMQQAVYSPIEEGHYALASDCYCHFTSPIRRYPDLTVHRQLTALATGKKMRNDFDELTTLGEHCSERERRAESAERELVKVKLLEYMSTRIGEKMDAIITGVREFGLFARGIELPAEGFIHVTSLADDYYRYDSTSHSLTGFRSGNAYRLGDRVRAEVANVDVERRELDFRVIGRPKHAARPKAGHDVKRGKKGRKGGAKATGHAQKHKGKKGPRDKSRRRGR